MPHLLLSAHGGGLARGEDELSRVRRVIIDVGALDLNEWEIADDVED